MPSTVPQFQEKVSILEIFQNQQILNRKILDEDYSNFTTHPSISNGLVFSPNDKNLYFTVSDYKKSKCLITKISERICVKSITHP